MHAHTVTRGGTRTQAHAQTHARCIRACPQIAKGADLREVLEAIGEFTEVELAQIIFSKPFGARARG